jgi:hypothetical protein
MFGIICWLKENKEWLFSGIGVTFLLGVYYFISNWIRSKKMVEPKQTQITGNNCFNFQVGDSLTINDSHFGGKGNAK